MSIDEMDQANRRDMVAKRALTDARTALDAFLADPPARARQATIDACETARRALTRDIDQIVAAWN